MAFIFDSHLNFTEKLRGKYKEFHIPPLHIVSSTINTPHQSGTFVTINEATLTHYCHPMCMIYMRIHSLCCASMGLDKCIMICAHPYSIIQNSFIALKIL